MIPNGLDIAEAQWRAQFEAMKAALSDLKLPPSEPPISDSDDEYEGYSSGSSPQDFWDFISDDDGDVENGDYLPSHSNASVDDEAEYGAEWFAAKCSAVAFKNGLSSDAFQSQILSVLLSQKSEDELQSQLTDLIGFEDLDLIIELLGHRSGIVNSVTSQGAQPSLPAGRRLLTKAEREEALRVQDYEHKNAALAPSLSREPKYPHVYKTYNAGNSLNHAGRKYGLPDGSQRLIFDKYEEYAVPAGKKGVLGPGQKLVKIAEMDGLCRNTFKGYKTLNRMQSLVHPVAYRTNENMLICAPTGAVSWSVEKEADVRDVIATLTLASGKNRCSNAHHSTNYQSILHAEPHRRYSLDQLRC